MNLSIIIVTIHIILIHTEYIKWIIQIHGELNQSRVNINVYIFRNWIYCWKNKLGNSIHLFFLLFHCWLVVVLLGSRGWVFYYYHCTQNIFMFNVFFYLVSPNSKQEMCFLFKWRELCAIQSAFEKSLLKYLL